MFACSKNSRELNNTIEISIYIYKLFGLQNMIFSPQLSQNGHIVLICAEKPYKSSSIYTSSSTSSESKRKPWKRLKK